MPKRDHPYRPSENAATLHVSPRGKQKWSGLLPEPNAHDSDGPLPDLPWAFQRLREAPPPGPVTILLDDGTWFLDEPLVLGPEAPLVTLAARPGCRATLSGGRRIEGFTETARNGRRAWVATLPDVAAGSWYFRSLYVNGSRRPRTRLPADGAWRIREVPGMTFDEFIGPPEAHHGTFYCEPGQVGDWANVEDVDAVAVHYWLEERLPLASADPETGRVTSHTTPVYPLKDDAAARCARFWFENVREALAEPGQWYLDRPTGELTYLPTDEEQLGDAEVIAPHLEHLVRVAGDPDRPVRGVVLRGLHLAHCDWTPIPGRGSDAQAAVSVRGMVRLGNARQCAIEDCRIGPGGPYGLELTAGCRGNRVSGCTFEDLGAGGVKLIGSGEPSGRCSHNIIKNCRIARCTSVFPSAVGVLIVHADHNTVRGNHIHHLEYSGISCGWTWGFGDCPTHHNLIADNHIHHLGTGLLNDMGGVYTLGEQPGTVLRGNHIHHITAHNYGGWAIYADEGSSYLTIERNLLHHTSSECFNLHYGRENAVRNNVLAFSGLGVVSVSAAGEWNSLTLERNILLAEAKPVLVARDEDTLTQRGFLSDLNVLWDASGEEIFAGDERRDEMSEVTWRRYDVAELRAMGYDLHSVVADPGFADAGNGDFRLPDETPARALGFRPFTAAGVYVGWEQRAADRGG